VDTENASRQQRSETVRRLRRKIPVSSAPREAQRSAPAPPSPPNPRRLVACRLLCPMPFREWRRRRQRCSMRSRRAE